MACPRCDAPLVQIEVSPGLVLRSCARCEGRWWARDGRPAGLDDVLTAVGPAPAPARAGV